VVFRPLTSGVSGWCSDHSGCPLFGYAHNAALFSVYVIVVRNSCFWMDTLWSFHIIGSVSESCATRDRRTDRKHEAAAPTAADDVGRSMLTESSPSSAAPQRKPGRPRRADAPVVPWDLVDLALVFGEPARDPRTGQEGVKFPSLAELAKRFGVSRNLVWRYADRSQCFRRREEARLKTQARFEQKVIEQAANARASEASDVARLVDDVIASFRKAFDDGRVRVDSASDLDRLIRLKELLGGRADSRGELHGQLSLEAIQGRHRRLRDQVDAMTPELMGTAPQLVDNDARAHGENDGTARELARTSHVAGEPDVPGELGEEERGDGAAH
jgi:hypothetical protein